MLARRIATAVATLLAVTGLGACGNAPVTEARRSAPAAVAPVPATGARPVTREVKAAAQAVTAVRNGPSAFRFPPGSRVTALSDHESGASFTLTAPDPEAVLSFYRGELPRGPFEIVADQPTSLAFRDADGWAGMIHATAYRVTVAFKHA